MIGLSLKVSYFLMKALIPNMLENKIFNIKRKTKNISKVESKRLKGKLEIAALSSQ